MGYLEIVCLGQVRPLKAGQVRPIAKLVPHLHKQFAVVFYVTYFVKGVHIIFSATTYLHGVYQLGTTVRTRYSM